jgi:hypothetical protein
VTGSKYQPKENSRLDNITEENSDSTPLRLRRDDQDSLLDDNEMINYPQTEKKKLNIIGDSPLLKLEK